MLLLWLTFSLTTKISLENRISLDINHTNFDITSHYVTIKTPTDHQPMETSSLSFTMPMHCITYYETHLAKNSLLQNITVNTLGECVAYCKYTKNCGVFSFHLLTKKCSFYPKSAEVRRNSRKKLHLATGQIDCVECLGDEKDIVEQSKNGIYIRSMENKCLAVTNTLVPSNKTKGFKLAWRSCWHADRWVFEWTERQFFNNKTKTLHKLLTISKFKSDWALEWHVSNGLHIVFLARKRAFTHKGILFRKSLSFKFETCIFEIQVPGVQISYLYFNEETYECLSGVRFALQNKNRVCPLKQFSVINGEAVNENKVPFFLPDSIVTVRCRPGYGILSQKFTSYQDVECSVNNLPKPCTSIEMREDEDWEAITIYLLLIIFVAITPLFCCMVAVVLRIFCRKKRAEEDIQGN